ncbi:protease inhibitor I42 family protein [Accumulibacter sp.]|uniref:protease inhibitor I42 family protein n=1 Tax=Accumulibacter sp. TaxID=2053492 RepID=UPI0025FA408C|nr:protease inhibitor I42 family protein [Accumulibacter sp.]MCM8594935.1 protease inhibitor I42 family protein [Accumulibacter sp.]MCM8625946.1 protease inhibitor I42 family protein [Accumulibacter sp.]MDS4049081.1 protease inhibitor I42 family protein [Accumulibacter sp.]
MTKAPSVRSWWRRSRACWCIAGLAILASAGAGDALAQNPDSRRVDDGAKAMMLSQVDSGRTIDLRVGESLLLRLADSPTTGFTWTVSRLDDRLALVSEDFSRGASRAPGSGGSRTWTFVARQPGVAGLELKRWRAWEGEGSVIERFAVTVRIRVD